MFRQSAYSRAFVRERSRIDQVQTKPITQFSFRATVRSQPKTEFYDLIRYDMK